MLKTYLTFIFLFISILSLWIPTKNKVISWSISLFITIFISVASGVSNIIATSSILALYGLVFLYQKAHKIYRNILWLVIFALGLCLELHLIPGFHNLLVLNKVQFTPDALPYNLHLNLDKTIVGLIIVGFTNNYKPLERNAKTSCFQTTLRNTDNNDSIIYTGICQIRTKVA